VRELPGLPREVRAALRVAESQGLELARQIRAGGQEHVARPLLAGRRRGCRSDRQLGDASAALPLELAASTLHHLDRRERAGPGEQHARARRRRALVVEEQASRDHPDATEVEVAQLEGADRQLVLAVVPQVLCKVFRLDRDEHAGRLARRERRRSRLAGWRQRHRIPPHHRR
jgi:hypothetical protein